MLEVDPVEIDEEHKVEIHRKRALELESSLRKDIVSFSFLSGLMWIQGLLVTMK